MTALSADARRAKYGAENAMEVSVSLAANAVIYAGAIVHFNASGYGTAGADTASFKYAGLAIEYVSNNGGANGAKSVRCLVDVIAPFAVQAGSITIADCGLLALTYDDNTVCDAATGTNDIPCGTVYGMEGSNALIYLGHSVTRANAA